MFNIILAIVGLEYHGEITCHGSQDKVRPHFNAD
jgi:hypothetical protein